MERTSLTLDRRLFWRLGLGMGIHRQRDSVPSGNVYLGTDLGRAMSRDLYRVNAMLSYRLTDRSAWVVEGEREISSFRYDGGRDGDFDRLATGLRTQAYLNGSLLVGMNWFHPRHAEGGSDAQAYFVEITLQRQVTPKTRLGLQWHHDLGYSLLATSGSPIQSNEMLSLYLHKDLLARFDLELTGRRQWMGSQGAVTITLPSGEQIVASRSDTAYDAIADLGYRFRSRYRIGIMADYTTRRSTIEYFGVSGLTFGLSFKFR
jgi:hypothetical protein